MATPEHPMLPFLVELELGYDPKAYREYAPVELVRYALGATDYWADLAVGWLEQGVSAAELVEQLSELESQQHRPQQLRHRAKRLRKAVETH